MTRTLAALARDTVRDFMENAAVGHPDEITTEWLMELHPSLTKEEAEDYRLFCKRSTIVFGTMYLANHRS
jgi:hypothetical protein